MDRLDLSLSLEQNQEAVYASNDEDGCGEMSERVSTLASSVYAEFERMIQKYGSGVVEQLMPMVINVLEQLESSYNENNEQAVEIELLAEDNEQLMTQYEREKQLKKLAETKYLEFEDSREQDKQELQTIIDQLELTCKQNENKIKSLQDQVDRTEERLADQNREYDTLHTRHTEMLHAYMEKIEYQTKASTPATPDINSPYKRHISVAQDLMSSSQTNLAMRKSELRSSSQLSMTAVHNEYIPGESRNDKSIDDECHADESEIESSTESAQVVSHLKRLTANIEAMNVDSEREIRVDSGVIESTQSEQFPAETYISGNLELSPEARAILQSTPELSSKTQSRIALEDTADESVYHTPGIDITAAQEYRQMSLQAEMQEGPKSAGSMYELNDQSGWKEMDHLLNENKELLDLKNKLQTQKNDLIRSVEELSNEKELQDEEISGLQATKTRMKLKISEQESALKKTRLEFEKSQIQLKNKMAEERISSANRKRFTRVEMAKVLMERNQYKERLMELQEAVRWTEMIRASKENHIAAIQQKKKSSIWKLFSNLFSTTTGSPTSTPSPKRSAAPAQPVNLWFNQTNQLADRRRSNAATTPTSSNTAVAYPSKYQADPGYEGLTERQRQERRERYKYVKEHIVSEGRHQAYGWSLPANYSGDQEGAMAVPVPVYCRPLNTEPAMKIWCAAGINLNGGRTLAGNFIGLPADFAEPSLSTVWIGTSTHSCSKVTIINSNNPSIALDQFIVSSSHLLCMAAVDGLNDAEPKSENIVTGQQADKSTKPTGGSRHTSPEHSLSVLGIQAEEESFPDDVDGTPTFSSILPTMWLGAQSGKIYIHSAVGNWKKCLQSAKLKDSLLSIIYTQGRVLVALADGTVAIFHRKPDGRWDLSNYHLLDLGRPHHSIRCMAPVHDFVWCGYKNKIQVINPQTMKIEKAFDAHPRRESQVRQLACIADGVWVSIRLDSTLRLYNAHTFHHLQDVDIEPYVSKMLGTGKFGFSFVRITALLLTEDRLWVGTGNGIILSVPLVSARPLRENDEDDAALTELRSSTSSGALFMPYCAMVHAQLSFHGHLDSVKFFVAVPGSAANVEAAKAYSNAGARPPSPSNVGPAKNASDSSLLLMSGGEGYIDFRVGDDEQETNSGQVSNVERSHLLVWQVGQ